MPIIAALLFVLAAFAGPASGAGAPQPELAQKWVLYAQQAYAARDYDKAIKAFSTAARADSKNAAAWKGLGNCYYAKRDYAAALKYYKYALQLNPADSALGAYVPKLEAAAAASAQAGPADEAARLYNAKRYAEAILKYEEALALNPSDAKSWQGLGNCHYAMQDKAKAVEAYQKAIQLNPQNTALQNFLARYAPESAMRAGVEVEYGGRDWFQPLWRSFVLPGWGQFYNGQGVKGGVLMATDLLLLGFTVGTYVVGSSARQTYLGLGAGNTQAEFDAAYASWESMANLNHIGNTAWGVVYAYNLVDAVVSAKQRPIRQALFEEKSPALQFGFLPKSSASGATLRLFEF